MDESSGDEPTAAQAIDQMLVAELRAALQEKGLDSKGLKSELADRLKDAVEPSS